MSWLLLNPPNILLLEDEVHRLSCFGGYRDCNDMLLLLLCLTWQLVLLLCEPATSCLSCM